MAKIERKVVTGTGAQTVDVTGWGFAKVDTDGNAITISLVGTGGYSKDFADDERIVIPASITALNVGAPTGRSWKLSMQKTVPDINQSELKISRNGDGKYVISGDDSVIFVGQDVDPATVDITKVQINLESLSQLFMTALSTKTVNDAARYCKMKDAFLATYSK
ncbi:hypothetical protein V7128_16930 [Neobacillus vireti]|uniref:hypothetical protein n=1 Tax=Neobacillus vireti TaxID=220686 RepID=UPI0030002910